MFQFLKIVGFLLVNPYNYRAYLLKLANILYTFPESTEEKRKKFKKKN